MSNTDESSNPSPPGSVPSLGHHYSSVESRFDSPYQSQLFEDGYDPNNPHISTVTYCTTQASFDEYEGDEDSYSCCDSDDHDLPSSETLPATPQEFADLFPTTKRLTIKHDDSTLDGNMNLRVDAKNGDRTITLFHLRMYDLRDRDFSFRRYGRDCGREVAHVKRKFIKPSPQRPALQRSVSKALHSFRGKSEQEKQFKLAREDSGYGSDPEEEEYEESELSSPSSAKPTNTCTLEFSNYAHVDLNRRGGKQSKKYEFEYWGKTYVWQRKTKEIGDVGTQVSFNLVNESTKNVVAYIVPNALTPAEAAAEQAKGGFVPPCSLWMQDTDNDPIVKHNLCDVADVVIATGMTALVDDCIKRKFHKKKTVQLVLPVPLVRSQSKMKMEYIGPKQLIDEMLHRRPLLSRSNSSQTSRSGTPSRPMRTPTY